MKARKYISAAMAIVLSVMVSGCSGKGEAAPTETPIETVEAVQTELPQIGPTMRPDPKFETTKEANALINIMTLEEKAAQMVQGAAENITVTDLVKYGYGGVFGTKGNGKTSSGAWKEQVEALQDGAMKSGSGIPIMYGLTSTHGASYINNSVVFGQNINLGAARDTSLTYDVAVASAQELKSAGVRWTFSPCVVNIKDPRWGETFDCYSTDLDLVKEQATSYVLGMSDESVMTCARYFITGYSGTYNSDEEQQSSALCNIEMSEAEIFNVLMVYRSLIDAGCKTIMLGSGSVNGVNMHENKELITDTLKGDTMQFDGIVLSDFDGIHTLDGSLKEQVIKAVNAGVDVLMETDDYEECKQYIIEGVQEGKISMDRVNDAVTRILNVKEEMGLFDDPYGNKEENEGRKVGSLKVRKLATELVEKSAVLLKNEDSILPFSKSKKLSIYVTGPAADDIGVQCGGYTMTESGRTDAYLSKGSEENKVAIKGGTTILDSLKELSKEYDITIITDKKKAKSADITLLCLGEEPYSKDGGNTNDISITGPCALEGNEAAIKEAKELGHKTVTLIVAGRNVGISEYMDDWDAIVMCYLPGTEGEGIGNLLVGKSSFSAKLAMPWYKTEEDILKKDDDGNETVLFGFDYGREY